jgi:hypothetical protein
MTFRICFTIDHFGLFGIIWFEDIRFRKCIHRRKGWFIPIIYDQKQEFLLWITHPSREYVTHLSDWDI